MQIFFSQILSAKRSNYISFSFVIRYIGEDSDVDYYRDSSSDGSSDSEFGKRNKHSITQRSNQYRTGDASLQMSRLSVLDKHFAAQEGFSSDESETGNPQGLLFEYFDQDPPYSREPLADKVSTDLT
jgi:hypothetical protein